MEKLFTPTLSATDFIDQTLDVYASCDADLKEINSLMDKEILEVRKKYTANITAYQKNKDEAFEKLESFACTNQDLLFSVKKSLKTKYGTLGFRLGKPRFNLYKGTTWETITNFLKEYLPNYVRVVAEPAKDKLMADRYLPEVAKYFPALGMNVVQEENFYIDLKR